MQDLAVMPDMLEWRVGQEFQERVAIALVVNEAVTEPPAHPLAAVPLELPLTEAIRGYVVETVCRGEL